MVTTQSLTIAVPSVQTSCDTDHGAEFFLNGNLKVMISILHHL